MKLAGKGGKMGGSMGGGFRTSMQMGIRSGAFNNAKKEVNPLS